MTVRALHDSEYSVWEALCKSSPQSTVFHTREWNSLMANVHGTKPLYIVCEKKGVLGGAVVHLDTSGSEVIIGQLDFNSPLFDAKVAYDALISTYKGYQVHHELNNFLHAQRKKIWIRNHPALWNVRPYIFHRWVVSSQYTHILNVTDLSKLHVGIDKQVRESIGNLALTISEDLVNDEIRMYWKYAHKRTNLDTILGRFTGIQWGNLIQHLRKSDIVRFMKVSTEGIGTVYTMVICSKEDKTLYVGPVYFPRSANDPLAILPSLYWRIVSEYGKEFRFVNLGESENLSISIAKDKLGAELTPFAIAKFGYSRLFV